MDISQLPEPLRTRAEKLVAQSPAEKVRGLLHSHVQDAESFDEIRSSLRSAARASTFFLQQRLDALELILSEPQTNGTLLHLVEWDANWAIDHDQTDRGAAVFLGEIADLVREVLADINRHTRPS